MRIVIISNNRILISGIELETDPGLVEIIPLGETDDVLQILNSVKSLNPGIIIIDHSFLKDQAFKLLSMVKLINQKTKIIFLTEDNSIELGREIIKSEVFYYGILPMTREDLSEVINSAIKLFEKNLY